ncbi:hypothetical protein BFP70_04930 [Thioclava sp. SK-1]|nr:hypothetical protein BFP70_04930 [Thioclava sp. SK-1]
MKSAVETVLKRNYANFSGRAKRPEFWWFVLFVWLGQLVLSIVDSALFGELFYGAADGHAWFSVNGGPLTFLFSLAMLIPSIAVAVRRLHDVDRTGWWMLLAFVPLIGTIILIVFLAGRSRPDQNRFDGGLGAPVTPA